MNAIFLDIETTGLDTKIHRPLDIAFKVLDLHTHELKSSYQSLVKWPQEVWEARDLNSIEINGYTWDDVCRGNEPESIRKAIEQIFEETHIQRGQAVFICQNPSFDRAFFNQLIPVYSQEKLNWPYHWLDLASMYWTKQLQKALRDKKSLPQRMNLSKNAIALASGLPVEASPHRAINGVDHLIQCYLTVLYEL
ncbi:MAG: DNA polymerase III subunit epsilon [Chlamydiales bacterium 38-26]|nr:3'-5' exonuclease [Chlamydiales bacterium]OJV11621.1 MAG: DNA polymerase III subunit epsilon [Chlamydiales bacterium 38-26]